MPSPKPPPNTLPEPLGARHDPSHFVRHIESIARSELVATPEGRLQVRAAYALYVRAHPDGFVTETVALAQGPLAVYPNDDFTAAPDLVDPETVEIQHPELRELIGLATLPA